MFLLIVITNVFIFLLCSTSSYYRGAHGIIIVYDITQKKSFDGIKKWMKEIGVFADADACKLLVGNKTDLDNRVISTDEGRVSIFYFYEPNIIY